MVSNFETNRNFEYQNLMIRNCTTLRKCTRKSQKSHKLCIALQNLDFLISRSVAVERCGQTWLDYQQTSRSMLILKKRDCRTPQQKDIK